MKQRWTLGLVIASLALAASASAQPRRPKAVAPPPPSAAAPARPQPLAAALEPQAAVEYRLGLGAFDLGDYAAARAHFQAAFERSRDPRLLWNMAVCEKSQRHYAAALVLLERFVELGGAGMSEAERNETKDVIDTMQALVSTVRLRVDQADAQVSVDGVPAGKTPLPSALRVDLGLRRIALEKEGFERYLIEREFGGGSQVEIDVNLRPAVREGRLQIQANMGDRIELDGEPVGHGRWQGVLLAGEHQLRVTREGMRPYLKSVQVVAGKEQTLYISLTAAEGGGVPSWLWVGAGVVAAGGLAAGGYFLFRPARRAGPEEGTLGFPVRL